MLTERNRWSELTIPYFCHLHVPGLSRVSPDPVSDNGRSAEKATHSIPIGTDIGEAEIGRREVNIGDLLTLRLSR